MSVLKPLQKLSPSFRKLLNCCLLVSFVGQVMFLQGLHTVKIGTSHFICVLCNVSQAGFLYPPTPSTGSV